MASKISKKRISLDDLAHRMAVGFKGVNANFKRVNANHESLARMVAKGFEDVTSRMATKADIAGLDEKIDSVKTELKIEIQGLSNSVNNYLKLTDKRYLELKNNQKVLAKYIKIVIQKSKIPVDLKELEMVLK